MPDNQTIINDNWKGTTDGGSFGINSLFFMLRVFGLRTMYFFMAFAIPFYVFFRKEARQGIMSYYQKIHGLPTSRSFFKVFKNNFLFGKMMFDRFSIMAGDRNFRIDFINNDKFWNLCEQKEGFMLGSSHIGSFELAGYMFHQDKKKINSLVFDGETAAMQKRRIEAFAKNGITGIAVKSDMSHIFAIKNAFDNGEIVSMPCDRMLGSNKKIQVLINGVETNLPLGPFITAAQMNVKLLSVFVMREKFRHYKVYVNEISAEQNLSSKEKAKFYADSFAEEIQKILNLYPDQWFNFYNFWN